MPHHLIPRPLHVPVAESPVTFLQRVRKWLTHFLALFGLLFVGVLIFLYFQGQQASHTFDEEFIGLFGEFVAQILKTDVASAMIIRVPIEPTVTIEQAATSLKKEANKLSLKFLSNYSLHQELDKSATKPEQFVEIFQFCEPAVAIDLLNYNPDFAFHLPYRIVLYKDARNQLWLATLNFNLLLHGSQGIDPKVKVRALKVQDNLLKMMGASAHGA